MSLSLTEFRFAVDQDGIAVLAWDQHDRSLNIFTEVTLNELERVIDHITQTSIKGCIIISGKADGFSGGADIRMLDTLITKADDLKNIADPKKHENAMREFIKLSSRMSALYRRLETSGKSFVCAIHGICVGGAFELALACHHRILSNSDKTKIGLPEIKIGIFPGAGGTQRLTRLIPTQDALLMMLKGQTISAERAADLRLVDAVVDRDTLLERAKTLILNEGKTKQSWDQDGFRLPSGPVYSRQGMMMWPAANAICRKETFDNYPAARALLQTVYEGLQVDFERALTIENRYFAAILQTTEAKSMIRSLFVSMTAINKGARRPKNSEPKTIKKIGLVGVGFMGAGIATVSADAGLDVVLIDRDEPALQKGLQTIVTSIDSQVQKGRLARVKAENVRKRFHPTLDYNALRDCDVIIEAVFEDPILKMDTLKAIAVHSRADALIATNTSTLPISDLAQALSKKEQFLGIHFFSPVDRMPLVEIIRGQSTSDQSLAIAFDFVRLIKKTPIIVNDARGFYANRCVLNYLVEGHLMLAEGVPPAMIENLARMAGMPVGPLALSDDVALDLILKIIKATQKALGNDAINPIQAKIITELVETHNRLGRKNGKGFYIYEPQQPKRLWPELKNFQTKLLKPDAINQDDIKFRLLATQALEAVRTMEQGIIEDPREADIGAILGFGFAPFTGGPLSMIEAIGFAQFNARCERLVEHYGPRFKLPQLLHKMIAAKASFYDPDFQVKKYLT